MQEFIIEGYKYSYTYSEYPGGRGLTVKVSGGVLPDGEVVSFELDQNEILYFGGGQKDRGIAAIQQRIVGIHTEATTCKHLLKHTELTAARMATMHGYKGFNGKPHTFETPAVPGYITTYCADCGEKLRTVELKGV